MDVMLDIETLGTGPGCVVLSIAAMAFEPMGATLPDINNSGLVFYQNITIFDQLLLGLHVDGKTIEWWKAQSSEAKAALAFDQMKLQGSLFRLNQWFANLPGKEKGKVWAKSPDFDLSILDHCYSLFNMAAPWTYRDKADVRTLGYVGKLVGSSDVVPPMATGTAHNALDDCTNQASFVQAILRGMKNGTA